MGRYMSKPPVKMDFLASGCSWNGEDVSTYDLGYEDEKPPAKCAYCGSDTYFGDKCEQCGANVSIIL